MEANKADSLNDDLITRRWVENKSCPLTQYSARASIQTLKALTVSLGI